ncbi:MAG: helix-turn-helix domain-containing protein [Bacteroidales bacterium]|nr:helix-turn-helix domain-containing protein [Bacteroidales bacterium]
MDLQSIIENGCANVTIQITAKDLKDFANHLFETAVRRARAEQASADGEDYLSKAEVMELFGVCDTTLWLWAKNNYLKPVKAGRKVLYRKGDVERFLSAKEDRP